MQERKIVQIHSYVRSFLEKRRGDWYAEYTNNTNFVAVCDDGSIWVLNPDDNKWSRSSAPPIPQGY